MAEGGDIDDLLSQLDNLPPPRPADQSNGPEGDTGPGIVSNELPGLENLLNRVAEKIEESSNEKTTSTTEKQAASKKSDPLEDLVRTLNSNIKGSNWLQENTADKWVQENPELAREYKKAAEDYQNCANKDNNS